MKLSLILETVQDLIEKISKRDNISPERVLEIVNGYSVDPKYRQFVIRQWATHNIRLPEDGTRVQEILTNFKTVRGKLENKDLLSYKKISDLQQAMQPYLGLPTKSGDRADPIQLPGVKLFKELDGYKSIIITNVNSLQKLGEGTQWCTRGSYGRDSMANHYLEEYGWIGQIWKDNRPIIQYTPDFSQVMDVNDDEMKDAHKLRELFLLSYNGEYHETALLNYMDQIVVTRWPELEDEFASDPDIAYSYATKVIKGAWPKGEEAIAKNPRCALEYSTKVINRKVAEGQDPLRWDAGEQSMMKVPNIAVEYAARIIRGRWLEAEPNIAHSAYAAYKYAAEVIKGRWPEAEPVIATSPNDAYLYAKYVILGPWPEGENIIATEPYFSLNYATDVLGHRFIKGEPAIASIGSTAVGYAKEIIGGPWPPGEKAIYQTDYHANAYESMLFREGYKDYKPNNR